MADSEATADILVCYRCGSSLAKLSLPLARLDQCPDCSVDLHVCRMCLHYAPSVPDGCDEEDAPEVRNKTAANFCDYFAPRYGAFDGREKTAESRARARLDALFGGAGEAGESTDGNEALKQAEDLFRK